MGEGEGRKTNHEGQTQKIYEYSHDVIENKGSASAAGGNSRDVIENKGHILTAFDKSHDLIDG